MDDTALGRSSASEDEAAAAVGPGASAESREPGARAGEPTLMLLATPLNFMILRALAERPMRLAELRRATGLPAQTTLRGHLATLSDLGALDKRPSAQMPYAVENALTPMGLALLEVARLLQEWLGQAPDGPVSLESGTAKGTVKAFVDGWSSTMMRGLAARPMTLTELDRGITELSYPALERRLSSMRMAGLIEARESAGAGTPYAVTEWARRGVVPLGAAGYCERLYMRDGAATLTQVDIEAAFLLALPLVELPRGAGGACRLEVEADPSVVREPAGVRVTLERGRVVACDSRLGPEPGDYAVGSVGRWFAAIGRGKAERLRFGAAHGLAENLVSALRSALLER